MEREDDEMSGRSASARDGAIGGVYEVAPGEQNGSVAEEHSENSVSSSGELVVCFCGNTVDSCQGHHLSTRRLIAEPPMFDYDDFIENRLPSDIQFSKLFPNDVVRWTRCRDVHTEGLLIHDYRDWVRDMEFHADPARRDFYEGLFEELDEDWGVVFNERMDAFEGVEPLGEWEYFYLDKDGGTKGIQAWSVDQWNEYIRDCKEAFVKYSYLAPSGYEPRCFYSWDTNEHTKLGGTPCDAEGNVLIQEQDQQSTLTSDDNPRTTTNSKSPSPEPSASGKQEDEQEEGRGREQEQLPSAPPSPPSPLEDEEPFNYEDYAWYSGV